MATIRVLLIGAVTLCCAPLSHGQAIVCPSGLPDTTFMAVYNDRCFQFVSAQKYWDDARNYCWEHQGRLVKLDNWQTNSFIVNTLNALKQWHNKGVWIGLHDLNVELHWQWVTNDSHVSESLGWSNWGSGHPRAVGHAYRDCVRMVRKNDWQWHETPCHKLLWKYRFICEYEPRRGMIEYSARVLTASGSFGSSSPSDEQQKQPDASIPGVRRSSPFNRGRQQPQQAPVFGTSDGADVESQQGDAEFQIGSDVSAEHRDVDWNWRYSLVAGAVCLCLLATFTFILVLLLVRLWRMRRRDRVQTIDALSKSRMWRAVNTRDTDSVYDSRHVVYPRAPWENEYFLQKGRSAVAAAASVSMATGRGEGESGACRVSTLPLPYETWALGTDIDCVSWAVTDQPAQQKLAYETRKQD